MAAEEVLILKTDRELARWCEALTPFGSVAVDTEGDSLHCYFEKLCLIQLAVPGHNILIDPLQRMDFSCLNQLLRQRCTVFHGCDYDLRMLRRGIGFVAGPIFDTYLAARIAGFKEVGLASLVKQFFGIDLPKTSQKANWARRPLTPTMIAYAVNDTKYLLGLADHLGATLRAKGRWSWFEEACRRAVVAAAEDRERDPERAWQIPGSASLQGQALAILRALWHWREFEAQQVDRPTFQILRNEELISLAKDAASANYRLPSNLPNGRRMRLRSALEKALGLAEPEWPQRVRSKRTRPSIEQDKRFEELKARRDRIASEIELDPSVIAPRQALERVARMPGTAGTVFMSWQRELLGL
jgi:ribonuclease D